jgi:uncharacterized repeat protein (TIGR01451 family)
VQRRVWLVALTAGLCLLFGIAQSGPLPGQAAGSTTRPLSASAPAGRSDKQQTVGTVTAVESASLAVDNNSNGLPDPGDTLKYSVAITNGTGASISNVALSDILESNLTFVAGTVHASPLVINDSYNALCNTSLYVGTTAPAGEPNITLPSSSGLFANDVAITDSFVFVSNAAPGHGSVTVNKESP